MKERNIVFLMLTLLVGVSTITLCACSNSKGDAKKDTVEQTVEQVVENDNQVEENKIAFTEYEYGESGTYTCENSLLIKNDTEAKFRVTNVYNEGNTSISEYNGTYKYEDNKYKFYYQDPQDSMWTFEYDFEMDGDNVVSGYYWNNNDNPLSDTYSCKSETLGELTLSVDTTGDAVLTTGDGVYNGFIYQYASGESLYEFSGSRETDGEFIDWMITIDDRSFTYEEYAHYIYKGHPESISANGDLGEIYFELDDNGNASGYVEYKGTSYQMSGPYYLNEAKEVESLYLADPSGVELSLTIETLDGNWVYYGSISFPLSAG